MTTRKHGLFAILALCALLVPLIGVPYYYISGSRAFKEIDIPLDEGLKIKGYLSEGTSPNGPWVVLAHGNRKDGQAHPLYQFIANNIPAEATVLAIDFRGFGRSLAAAQSAPERVLDRDEDLEAAIDYLKANYAAQERQIILIGHSMGSYQVLKITRDHPYRLVVPIGLGDFNAVLNDPAELEMYIRKFKASTGITLTEEAVRLELSELTPQALFSPCPQTPVALVFGAFEDVETLSSTYQRLPESCRGKVDWINIPLSNHTYWTEGPRGTDTARFLASLVSLSLLKWELIQLVDRQ